MSNRIIYNVEFNIPRVNLSLPGRQNRSNDGIIKITPGLDEVYEFWFGNMDGVPINLLPFKVKLVFWQNLDMDIDELTVGQSEVVFAKEIKVTQPYEGKVLCLFTNEDTLNIGKRNSRGLRWSLFMINEEGNVFPAQVGRNGERYGTVQLDLQGGLPIAEVILSA